MLIKDHCDISNYADDTTASCAGDNVDEVIEKLQNVASIMLTWFQSNYLQANPDKFQFILYNSDDKYMLTINKNVKLESLDYVKLLGVTVDTKLTFTRHVDELCSKAGKKINMLRRLANVLTMEAKCLLFQSFILSHFNFCPVVWHYCSMTDLRKVENIQKRALKIVFDDYSATYLQLRQKGDRPLLYVERLRSIAIEMFMIYITALDQSTYLN